MTFYSFFLNLIQLIHFFKTLYNKIDFILDRSRYRSIKIKSQIRKCYIFAMCHAFRTAFAKSYT